MARAVVILNIALAYALAFSMIGKSGAPWTTVVIGLGGVTAGVVLTSRLFLTRDAPPARTLGEVGWIWLASALMILVVSYVVGAVLGLLLIGLPQFFDGGGNACEYDPDNCPF